MNEETTCLECQGTGWIEEDAGGGNIKKFMCEKCQGRGWIRLERDDDGLREERNDNPRP